MPFTPTNVEPDPQSTVTVTFAGLMLLRPGADNTLEVGIHKYNRDHTFQVMLIVNKPCRPPRLIRLLSGPLFSDFEMIVEPGPVEGVQKFVTDEETFDACNGRIGDKDFRWAINFAALPGHEGVDFNDGAKPIAKLNTGILYTPNLTRENLNPVLTWGANGQKPLGRFSADLAASVKLVEDTGMTLRWTELGKVIEIPLPRENDPVGTTYTVALLNDPPYSDPIEHDELFEYYKILRIGDNEVPENFQCHIVLPPNHKSDEIPCLAGVLDPPGTH